MSTEKLVAAIVDGDAQQIQQSFNQVMADKALEYIDAARQVVAQNMFNVEEEVDYLDEAKQTPIRYKEVRNKKGKLEFQVLNPEDLHHDLGTPDQYEEPVSSDMIDLISDHHPLKLEK